MTNTKRDTIAEMKKDTLAEMIEYRNKKWKHTIKHTTEWSIFWEFLEDLQTLQAEPKQEADIETIHNIADDWIKALENKNTLTVYNTIRYLENMATKHLTQKTTVPKDGEDIKKQLEKAYWEWYQQAQNDMCERFGNPW